MSPSTVLNPKMLFLSSFLMMMRSDGSLKMSLMFFPVSAIFVMLFCFFYCQAAELPGTVVIVFAGMGGTAAPWPDCPERLRLIRNSRNYQSGCSLDGVGWVVWTGTSGGRQVPRISHVHGGRLHRRG